MSESQNQSQNQESDLQSWVDVFLTLKHAAEAQRGKHTVGFGEGVSISWPRTTGRDVMAISAVFDDAVRAHASDELALRWAKEADLVMDAPAELRAEQYIGNRSFWTTAAGAAVELTALGVPLPSRANVHAAIAELATERAPVRNAEGSGVLSMFVETTWPEMAARQLAFFLTLRGTHYPVTGALHVVPRTCNGDVLQLAVYWTEQLQRVGDDVIRTQDRINYARWDAALESVIQHGKHEPLDAEYAHNVGFWNALMRVIDSDSFTTAPAPWAFALPARPTPTGARRNADIAATVGKLELPVAKRWDDTFEMQRDLLANMRGTDETPDGLMRHIPRTTNDDVRQLVKFWDDGRKRAEDKGFADRFLGGVRRAFGVNDPDVSAGHVFKVWEAARANAANLPAAAAPGDLYSHNTEFWQALALLANQIAVTSETPRDSQVFVDSVKHGVAVLPDTLTSVLDALSGAGAKIATKVLAKPLLYLGAGVAGVVVLYLIFRPKGESPIPVARAVRL